MIGKELKTHARRSGDFAFRLGGEEFGMLFSASDERTAFEYAEGIRRAIEALKLEHKVNSTGPYVSVSIGVELFNGDEPCTSLYTDADVQLYRAKTSGRNRVMMQHIAEA
jgi:diguanylate cyclase (GGDEF)-like protein